MYSVYEIFIGLHTYSVYTKTIVIQKDDTVRWHVN